MTQLLHVQLKLILFEIENKYHSEMESSIFACSFCGKADRTEIKILKKSRPRRIGPLFSFEESMYSANIAYPIRLNLGMSAGSKAIAHCTTAADLIH